MVRSTTTTKTIMSTGPITSWEIEGDNMEAVTDFTFLGSMITADVDSSHAIKKHLLLGLQYFGHLMRREDSLEKTLMLGKCKGKRRRG